MLILPLSPSVIRFREMLPRQIIRWSKMPNPVFGHKKRKILCMIVHLFIIDVKSHTPEDFFPRFIIKPQLIRGLKQRLI